MAKNYEMLTKKANNILKWLPEWICNRYTSVTVDRYGHLFERHFERDSKHLKERCLMEHKNSTAFFCAWQRRASEDSESHSEYLVRRNQYSGYRFLAIGSTRF